MKYTLVYRSVLFLYIGFLVGYAAAQVGVPSATTVADWRSPFAVAIIVSFPAFMGYCTGKSE